MVQVVGACIKFELASGRRDVEATARRQFDPRDTKVQLNAIFMRMSDPQAIELMIFKAGKRQLLETFNCLTLLSF